MIWSALQTKPRLVSSLRGDVGLFFSMTLILKPHSASFAIPYLKAATFSVDGGSQPGSPRSSSTAPYRGRAIAQGPWVCLAVCPKPALLGRSVLPGKPQAPCGGHRSALAPAPAPSPCLLPSLCPGTRTGTAMPRKPYLPVFATRYVEQCEGCRASGRVNKLNSR